MKRVVAFLVSVPLCWGIYTCRVAADDTVVEPAVESAEPAIINHPSTGWELSKAAVNYLEPGADWFVTFTEGGPIEGLSGAIYTFKSHGWPLASVRAGYGLSDPTTYASLALDLPGLAGRFIPASIKGLSPGALNGALAFAAKYVRVGPAFGYDWSVNKPRWGLTVGAAITTSF